ncbi:MAG: sugar ABC transporter permease [Thermus sp.]|nr:sugar ABC transporter permease [Thermus sp.]
MGTARQALLRFRARGLANLEATLFLLPAYGLFLLFMALPVLEAAWLSLHQENLFGRGRIWAGLENYREALLRPEFAKSFWITVKFALITAPLELVLGLLAALLVYRPYPGVALFRTIFFLTTAVPTAVAAVAWGWFLHPVGGWANRFLASLGIPAQPWLTSTDLALPTLAVITAWAGVGFTAVLLTAGLQAIPEEVLEAAEVDGATPWTRFWRVILPLLSPTLFLVTILVVLRSLTAFGQIHLLTRGGPAESSMVWIYRVYQDAFFNFRVPLAAAEALLLLLLLMLLAGLQFWLLGRRVHYA